MERQNKTAYFQWLRLFAAAAVVLMHTAALGFNTAPVSAGDWTALAWWDSLVRWPVPIFMMITGALFLPRKTTLEQVLRRYVPRMALCYLVWSAVYALYIGGNFLFELAAGHFHLWYLPFLCGVYLAMPFLQRIVSDETLSGGLLAVSVVIGLFVPWMAEFLIFLFPGGGGIISSLKVHLEFTFFMDCLALVLLGNWLHQREITKKQRRYLYFAGILGVFVTFIATVWASRRLGAASSLFFDFKAPNNLCAAMAVFVFAKYNLNKLPRAVDALARCSFGVYLIHPMVIDTLRKYDFSVPPLAPLLWTPVVAAVVFAISAAAAAVLGRLPVVGKYLA